MPVVAGPGPGRQRRRQPVQPRPPRRRAPGRSRPAPRAERGRAAATRARDHRGHDPHRPGPYDGHPRTARRPRRRAGDRRLRHRLLLAQLPQAPTGGRAEDRPELRLPDGGRRERRGHRAFDDRARAQPGADRRGRGRRDAGDARAPGRAGLRQRAGLPPEPACAGRRAHRVAAGRAPRIARVAEASEAG